MNAKPLLIFSAIAAVSVGAMATAYVVEQRNTAARIDVAEQVVVEAPKVVEKTPATETAKLAEVPKSAAIEKTPETVVVIEQPKKPEVPKVVVEPKVAETPKLVEVPVPAETPKVVDVPAVAEAPKLIEAPKVTEAPKVVDAPKAVEETQVAVALPKETPAKIPAVEPAPVIATDATTVEPLPLVPKPEGELPKPEESAVAVVIEPPPKTPAVVVETPIAPPVAEDVLPAFDTVRVEATGDAVIAGRADPNSEVTIKWNGKLVGKTTANGDGSFVLVPEKPMKKGIGALTIEMSKNGELVQSEGSVIVDVKENAPALVAKIDPIAPTTVLQVPTTTDTPATGEVQLNAVDYDTAGNIVFSGRAKAGHVVRFYVDNKLTGEIKTSENGLWTFRGDERVKPGQHILRADAVDSKGKVQSRIELPFLRETAEIVAAAKITTPGTIITKTPVTPATEETAIASVEKKRSITLEKSAVEPVIEADQIAAVEQPLVPLANQQTATASDTPAVPDAEAAADPVQPVKLGPQKLVIQPGNNLWKLSREIYGKGRMFTVIYEANRDQVRNPNRIYPGQILTAPSQPN